MHFRNLIIYETDRELHQIGVLTNKLVEIAIPKTNLEDVILDNGMIDTRVTYLDIINDVHRKLCDYDVKDIRDITTGYNKIFGVDNVFVVSVDTFEPVVLTNNRLLAKINYGDYNSLDIDTVEFFLRPKYVFNFNNVTVYIERLKDSIQVLKYN